MKKERILPAGLVIVLDLLLIAAILCTFSWFHHIKPLWFGLDEDNDVPNTQFTKPITSPSTGPDNAPEVPDDGYDYSGDFGSKFGNLFLKDGESVILTDTEYKSKDMWVTLEEVNTQMYYNGKTYTVQYYVYDIYVRNIENLYTVSVSSREPIEQMVERTEDKSGPLIKDGLPIAAINGDYWGNDKQTLVAVRNGAVLRYSDYIESDICVLYYDGTMETISPREYNWNEIAAKAPYQIWNFGPALLNENSEMITDFKNFDDYVIDQRHPRASIGYYEPGHYCFVVVDGRSDDSQGVRMIQMAEIYYGLGCKVAYNFDGGDSAQAYYDGEMIRVDQERDEDGDDQRKLYDIVCIGEIRKTGVEE
ncbi:MAG: phosphodiester glycosidase family protein [Clostridia bacterium]|nr:phosphodiester glycosidase family protein [Clostridia bacterium]